MIKERLLNLLSKHSLSEKLIYEFFSDSQEVKDELNSLIESGEIVKHKKEIYLPSTLHLIKGKIVSIKENFSFASIGQEEDVYIDNYNLNSAFIDDEVYLRRISTYYYGKEEYEVFSIIKRSKNIIVGEIVERFSKYILKVDSVASNDMTFIINPTSTKLMDGYIVVGRITKITNHTTYVDIVSSIGHKSYPGVDISKIIYKYGADIDFNEDVKKQVESIPSVVLEEDKAGREDFLDHLIVTIDGDDAKDFDDAVEVERINKGYRVGVHIADVAHYVKYDTPLDKEALSRGTSIYVTDRVVPMLPFELSNGICSLNPNVERLVTSCIFEVDEFGYITSSRISKGIIKSKARLTYNYVNNLLNKVPNDKDFGKDVNQLIYLLNEVATKIRKRRNKDGALNIDSTEIKFVCNELGEPIEVIKREQGLGEKLIEDLMISANEQVSEIIESMELPFIYRIHERPKAKKMESFIKLSEHLGKKLNASPLTVTPIELANFMDSIEDSNIKTIMSIMMLRSLQKARYSSYNAGHFGLASKSYTHFTSPIRRYPDLLVHRLIDRYLVDGNLEVSKEFVNEIDFIAENTSIKERRAISIEREVLDLVSAKYMSKQIGNTFEGFINGMTARGMFVEINLGIDGFIPFDSIEGDYYGYDEKYMKAYGAFSNNTFSLGQQVVVKVDKVDIDAHMITFSLFNVEKQSKINNKPNGKGRKKDYGRKHKNYY